MTLSRAASSKYFLSFIVLLSANSAFGRAFNFAEKSVAAHLQGSFGSTSLGQTSFSDNLGDNVTMEDTHQYMQGGQIGFSVSPHDQLSFVFALELLKPVTVDSKGTNVAGEELYAFTNTGLAMNPFFAIEISHSKNQLARYFFGFGAGLAQVNMDAKFTMTTAGQAELGVVDYTEKIQGNAMNGYVSVGMERHFVDTSTFVAQLGYRYFKVPELKHKGDVTTLAEGAVSEGDTVNNIDGSKRQIDLSGVFLGLGFRFYIP